MRSREDATELTTGVDGRDGILTAGICGDSTGSGSGSGSDAITTSSSSGTLASAFGGGRLEEAFSTWAKFL